MLSHKNKISKTLTFILFSKMRNMRDGDFGTPAGITNSCTKIIQRLEKGIQRFCQTGSKIIQVSLKLALK